MFDSIKIPNSYDVTPAEWADWYRMQGIKLLDLGLPQFLVEDQYLWNQFVVDGVIYSDQCQPIFDARDLPASSLLVVKNILEQSTPNKGELVTLDLYTWLCRTLGLKIYDEE